MSNEQALREALMALAQAEYRDDDDPVLIAARRQADAALALPASAHGAEPSDAMVDAYLSAQRQHVEDADRFGRPNVGGLHTNTVREACRSGIRAALARWGAPTPPAAVGGYPALPRVAHPDGSLARLLHAYVDADRAQRAALAAAQAAQAGAVPEGCNHDWQPFYTGPTQTHVICARCDLMRSAPAQPDAADAARYRWLRAVGHEQVRVLGHYAGPAMDDAIDDAIALAAQAVAKGSDRG